MRSLWLSFGLLAVPLMFTSPAGGVDILSSCCVLPPDEGHPDAHPDGGPAMVGANARRPDERALEASAEAPIPVEVPLANAVASPRDARPRIVVPPLREPIIASEPLAPDTDNPNVAPCCTSTSEDGHADPQHFFALPRVKRPDERELEATAEAPVEEAAPLANAIALPADDPRIVVPPIREPIIAADNATPQGPGLIPTPPCCQAVGEMHAPDRDPEEAPPVLVSAKVKNRDERALEATVELPIPAVEQRVNAIGIPLHSQRGLSEPPYRPAPVDGALTWLRTLTTNAGLAAPVLLSLLAVGLWIRWARRRRARLGDQPAPQPHLPDVLTRLVEASEPVVEPTTAPAKELELEPA